MKEYTFTFGSKSACSSVTVRATCFRNAIDLLSLMFGDSHIDSHLVSFIKK